MNIKVKNKIIGEGLTPFIIAEAGINHNGSIDLAYDMIETAYISGADAIKFQTFKAEEFVSNEDQLYTYKSKGQEITESMLEMFKRYEFAPDEWFKIKKKCDEVGIIFLSTPQNATDLDLLMEIGIPLIKVGSDDFTNLPLLKDYSGTRLPMILSCGMADLGEIYQSLDCIGTFNGYPTILLLCTSQYPTPLKDVNLLKLKTLNNAFPMVTLGFSDHTQGSLASSLAVAMGASVFEKHFTTDNNLEGPDHWFSENPKGLKSWINSIRDSYSILGSSTVKPTKEELKMRSVARRSIIALKDINKGESFTKSNIGLKRPGDGLPPVLFDRIIGKKADKVLIKGQQLSLGDIMS